MSLDDLPEKLGEIAQRHREMLTRLAVLNPEDPATRALVEAARVAIENADYDGADLRLKEAETAELAAVRMAEALARQAQEAANQRRLKVAEIIAERGELSLMRLNYREAARYFQEASQQVPSANRQECNDYVSRYAYALYRQGTERVDDTALNQAIQAYREMLKEYPRELLPQAWAMTQNNLGNMLAILGEWDSDKERLTEARNAIESVYLFYEQTGYSQYEEDFKERLHLLDQLMNQ